MNIINLQDIKHSQLKSNKTEDFYSQSAVITDYFDFKDVFVHHEIIPPGIKSSHPHYHLRSEELIFILDGKPTANCSDEIVQLQPGDFIGFKPGIPQYHYLENKTNTTVTLLVISSKSGIDEVKYKP
jgi:uncharacterized cupin superfamily protein